MSFDTGIMGFMTSDMTARMLRLLSLLQTRREWSGSDLADRLGVTVRTVRRDIDRLRELGYPVDSARGHMRRLPPHLRQRPAAPPPR